MKPNTLKIIARIIFKKDAPVNAFEFEKFLREIKTITNNAKRIARKNHPFETLFIYVNRLMNDSPVSFVGNV